MSTRTSRSHGCASRLTCSAGCTRASTSASTRGWGTPSIKMRSMPSKRYYAMRIENTVTFAGALLLSVTALHAVDWPQWQGPDRTRVSRETGLLKQWPAGGPTVVWTATGVGGGYGSMAVAGDRVFVQGARGRNSVV